MTTYLSQEDIFHRYFEEFGDGIEPSDENLETVREFLLEKWRDRAAERGADAESLPTCLADSCKFSALFGSVVFGADIAGNYDHVFNMIDGEVFDINAEASDVRGRRGIHRHDPEFIGSCELRQSLKDCRERVGDWLRDFAVVYARKKSAGAGHRP